MPTQNNETLEFYLKQNFYVLGKVNNVGDFEVLFHAKDIETIEKEAKRIKENFRYLKITEEPNEEYSYSVNENKRFFQSLEDLYLSFLRENYPGIWHLIVYKNNASCFTVHISKKMENGQYTITPPEDFDSLDNAKKRMDELKKYGDNYRVSIHDSDGKMIDGEVDSANVDML